MFSYRSVHAAIREFYLCCIGSPQSRSRQLAALRRLDGHLLKDIGLTPEAVERAQVLADPPRPAGSLRLGQPQLNR